MKLPPSENCGTKGGTASEREDDRAVAVDAALALAWRWDEPIAEDKTAWLVLVRKLVRLLLLAFALVEPECGWLFTPPPILG